MSEKNNVNIKNGYITIEFTLIFLLLIMISSVIFDFSIYLYSKTVVIKQIELYRLEMNNILTQSPSEYINRQIEPTSMNLNVHIRNSRGILDEWGVGIDDDKLEYNARLYMKNVLDKNIEYIDYFKLSKSGNLIDRKWKIEYRLKVKSLFSSIEYWKDFKYIKGEFEIYSQNLYADMLNVDFVIEYLQRIQMINDFIEKIKEVVDSLSDIGLKLVE